MRLDFHTKKEKKETKGKTTTQKLQETFNKAFLLCNSQEDHSCRS